MKVYLAARYSRNAEMRQVRDRLVELGYEVTSRWIDQHGGELEESLTQEQLNSDPDGSSRFANIDVDDLESADIVVSFTGDGGGGKGGRHVEFGMALCRAKWCIIVGPRENVFHCLGGVDVVKNVDDLIELLLFTSNR